MDYHFQISLVLDHITQKINMTNEQFCKTYSAFYGDGINHIEQLVQTVMDGHELKELIEFFIDKLSHENNN